MDNHVRIAIDQWTLARCQCPGSLSLLANSPKGCWEKVGAKSVNYRYLDHRDAHIQGHHGVRCQQNVKGPGHLLQTGAVVSKPGDEPAEGIEWRRSGILYVLGEICICLNSMQSDPLSIHGHTNARTRASRYEDYSVVHECLYGAYVSAKLLGRRLTKFCHGKLQLFA